MASTMEIIVTAEDQASRVLEGVGDTAETTASDVDRSWRDTQRSSAGAREGFDKARESADELDTKAMGFRDTMTGVQDTMAGTGEIARGNLFEGFFLLGTGIGDLASGFANFLIPAIKNASVSMVTNAVSTARATAASVAHRVATVAATAATGVQTVAQRALNAAMRANPILLIVSLLAALAGAIVIAYQRSETFRNVVQGAMGAARDAVGWVIARGEELWAFFRDLPGKIRSKLSGMWDVIKDSFRGAINAIIGWWNDLSFTLEIPDNVVTSAIGLAGRGFTISTPNIPTLHSGGVFRAPPGRSEGLALLRDRERVSTPEADSEQTRLLRELVALMRRRSGGTRIDNAQFFTELLDARSLQGLMADTGAA